MNHVSFGGMQDSRQKAEGRIGIFVDKAQSFPSCLFLCQNPLTFSLFRAIDTDTLKLFRKWRELHGKTTVPQGVRVLAKWHEKNTLRFDLPIQRASGQWSLMQKSLLIHSILADFPIPPLYLVKRTEEENSTVYQALDGETAMHEHL